MCDCILQRRHLHVTSTKTNSATVVHGGSKGNVSDVYNCYNSVQSRPISVVFDVQNPQKNAHQTVINLPTSSVYCSRTTSWHQQMWFFHIRSTFECPVRMRPKLIRHFFFHSPSTTCLSTIQLPQCCDDHWWVWTAFLSCSKPMSMEKGAISVQIFQMPRRHTRAWFCVVWAIAHLNQSRGLTGRHFSES